MLVALAIALVVATPFAVARMTNPPKAEAQLGGAVGALLTTLSQTLCPVVTTLDNTVGDLPIVGEITGGLKALLCNLGAAEYRFHTVWEAPNGTKVVRTHNAVIGVPTLLNVDNTAGPELTGTIWPSGLTGLRMDIGRYGFPGPLPVSVEAVIKDPTGDLDKENIAFGYDQLGDNRSPQHFTAKLDLADLLVADEPGIAVDIVQKNPGDDTDLIASLFDGTPANRVDPTAGRVEFGNSPTNLGVDLTLADPLVATLRANVTGPVNAILTQKDGLEEKRFTARVEDIPNVMSLSIGQADPRIVYTGTNTVGVPQTIDRLTLNGTSTTPFFSRATNLNGNIEGLSSGTEFNLDQATNTVALNTTQPISLVELVAASRPPQGADLPAGGEQGAIIRDRTGEDFVIGARLRQLKSLSAGLAGPYTLHAETAGGPFGINARLEDLDGTVRIADLPTTLDLSADLLTGAITYTGNSTINSIDIDLTSTTPLFLGANQVGLLLQGVPTSFTVNLPTALSNFSFSANNPINKIEAFAKSPTATDDSSVLSPADAGAVLRKVGASTFLFARVFKLQQVDAGFDPVNVHAKMESGHRFVGDVIMEQPGGAPNLDLDATVTNLPADVTFGLGDDGTGGTKIDYTASDPINEISVNADGLGLLPGADPLHGVITTIPNEFHLKLPASGPVADFDIPSGQIGQIRVAAGALPLPDPSGDDNLTYRDIPGTFGISGRLSAIRDFSLGLDPIALVLGLSTNDSERKAIDADAQIQATAADPLQSILARLDKPSSQTTLNLTTADGEPTRMSYTGTDVINNIDLRAENLAGLPLIDGHLATIPEELDVCFDPGAGCQRSNPHNIGRREASNISLDIDDNNTSAAPLQLSAADIVTEPGADPIVIRGIRLHELGVDIGIDPEFDPPSDMNAHVFIDSDNRDFSVDQVTYDSIKHFALGTAADPARGDDRLVNLNGIACCPSLDTEARGSLHCGGRRQLDIEVLGVTLNLLDLPLVGQAVPLCSS
jgi:hypothetical protein